MARSPRQLMRMHLWRVPSTLLACAAWIFHAFHRPYTPGRAKHWTIACILLVSTMMMTQAQHAHAEAGSCKPWPLWQAYWSHFVQGDGRVIDHGENAEPSYSEGQAYTLFFTLVANDRSRFDLILNWMQREMAQNDLTRFLPAWKWGQRQGNDWGVMDSNPASDADMWLAYTLLQAGNLWQAPEYTKLGQAVLQNIKQHELTYLPDAGVMLAPGAEGFNEAEMWRFNPSYLPMQQLRYFARQDSAGPWASIAEHSLKMLNEVSNKGVVADWVAYHKPDGWGVDKVKGPVGSYDAIRVYLWAGMLHDKDPAKAKLLGKLKGMAQAIKAQGQPPMQVNTLTGASEGQGPIGFSAAVLPYLKSLKQNDLLQAQSQRVQAGYSNDLLGNPPRYYDQVLGLFGQGWLEQRYAFKADGSLETIWSRNCR